MRKTRLTLETRILLCSSIAALPGVVVAVYFIWQQGYPTEVKLLLCAGLVGVTVSAIRFLRRSVIGSMRTLSGLLAAIREGDYAIRGANSSPPRDALGEVFHEVNALGENLQRDRFDTIKTAVLLGKVLEEINVAVLGFDQEYYLRLLNPRARSLLDETPKEVEGLSAEELGVTHWLKGNSPRIIDVKLGNAKSRWELRRGSYYEHGEKCTLLFLSDLTPALREEERVAWKRLLQVLRHEVNNSLTPIRSLSSSLRDLATRNNGEWSSDIREGLDVIAHRSKSLTRFLNAYTRLAALPKPKLELVWVEELIKTVVALESRERVNIEPGSAVCVMADSAQLEQLLINLLRNAIEAVEHNRGSVTLSWSCHDATSSVEITISDDGLGIANDENLFVPFYTTKETGSGIGLVLSRQIAEAHGGSLVVENKETGQGCVAILRLPIEATSEYDRSVSGRNSQERTSEFEKHG